jgi:hypothetical protein
MRRQSELRRGVAGIVLPNPDMARNAVRSATRPAFGRARSPRTYFDFDFFFGEVAATTLPKSR